MSDKIIKIKVENVKPYAVFKIFEDTFSELYEYAGCNYNFETKECVYYLIKKEDVE